MRQSNDPLCSEVYMTNIIRNFVSNVFQSAKDAVHNIERRISETLQGGEEGIPEEAKVTEEEAEEEQVEIAGNF